MRLDFSAMPDDGQTEGHGSRKCHPDLQAVKVNKELEENTKRIKSFISGLKSPRQKKCQLTEI